jgi:hypothetical protein
MKIAMTMSWMLVSGALCLACAGQKIEPARIQAENGRARPGSIHRPGIAVMP